MLGVVGPKGSLTWFTMVALGLSLAAWANSQPSETKVGSVPVFNPAKTVVAILPMVNQTGKRGEADEVCVTGAELVAQAFTDRGFEVVAAGKVADYLSKKKIDLTDEESRGKSTLKAVGHELHANLVVCSGLHELDSDMKWGILATRKVGRAKLQMKILDVSTQDYLVNAMFEAKKKGGWFAPVLSKSKGLRSGALDGAIQAALEDFLKPYKVLPTEPETQKQKAGPG